MLYIHHSEDDETNSIIFVPQKTISKFLVSHCLNQVDVNKYFKFTFNQKNAIVQMNHCTLSPGFTLIDG